MDMDVELYDRTNIAPRIDGKELMAQIARENPKRKFDIVLDIGCGSGNVTKFLLQEFNIGHLYAADVDQNMLNLAKKQESNDKITYLCQDFNDEWDDLIPELKALEGKVSLIFTNYVICWIISKANLVANIHRFLVKGGQFYANIPYVKDIFKDLTPTQRVINGREFIKIPTVDEQSEIWDRLLQKNGLEVRSRKLIDKMFTYDFKALQPILVHSQLINLVLKNVELSDEAKQEMSNQIMKQTKTYWDENTKKELFDYALKIIIISAIK